MRCIDEDDEIYIIFFCWLKDVLEVNPIAALRESERFVE